jgi:hypothetical protein
MLLVGIEIVNNCFGLNIAGLGLDIDQSFIGTILPWWILKEKKW